MEQSPFCIENCNRLNKLSQTVAEETGANTVAHQSMEHRLDVLEENMKEQNGILVTLQKQADAIESMNGKIDGISDNVKGVVDRIDKIEHEPGDKYKKLKFEIIKYVVIGIIGGAIGYVLNGGITL